jgi:hypothetical protein
LEIEAMMPRLSYPGASERALFRTAIPQQRAKRLGVDATGRILLMAVLLIAAVQLIW